MAGGSGARARRKASGTKRSRRGHWGQLCNPRSREAADGRRFRLVRFILHFLCGAAFGGFLGLMSWRWYSFETFPWGMVLGGAVVVGLLAGFLGDRFWERLFNFRL